MSWLCKFRRLIDRIAGYDRDAADVRDKRVEDAVKSSESARHDALEYAATVARGRIERQLQQRQRGELF